MLIGLLVFGEILHGLLHGEISNAADARWPGRTTQREYINSLLVKANGPVECRGRIHSRTHPDDSLSVVCANSTTGGFDTVVDKSTGLHRNWLFALVGPVPFKAGGGTGWGPTLVMY